MIRCPHCEKVIKRPIVFGCRRRSINRRGKQRRLKELLISEKKLTRVGLERRLITDRRKES